MCAPQICNVYQQPSLFPGILMFDQPLWQVPIEATATFTMFRVSRQSDDQPIQRLTSQHTHSPVFHGVSLVPASLYCFVRLIIGFCQTHVLQCLPPGFHYGCMVA